MCTHLATLHPIETLERIRFLPQYHLYYVNDRKANCPSVTGLLKRLFPQEAFNAALIIEKNIFSWRNKPESKYYKIINGLDDAEASRAIQKEWKESNRLGTLLHFVIEQFLNGEQPKESDLQQVAIEFGFFKQFLKDHNGLKPFRTELSMYYEKEGRVLLTGQADCLFVDQHGRTLLVDFKRVEKRLQRNENDFDRPGVGAMEGVVGNDLHKYSCQLCLYAAMLRRHGVNVDAKVILQLHPSLDGYKIHHGVNLDEEAESALCSLSAQ